MSVAIRETAPTPVATQQTNAARWFTYLGACAILFVACILPILRYGIRPNSRFGTSWASGNAAIHGQNPYAVFPETFRANWSIFHGPAASAELNLNPPCTVPALQLLAHLPLAEFAAVWTLGSFALLSAGIALLLWDQPQLQNRQILWLFLNALVIDTLIGAETYCLLFLLAALGLLSIRRGFDWPAAIAIGTLVAIKPTVIFWPIFLFIGGRRRLALRSAAVTILTSLMPIFLYGPHIYMQWREAIRNDPHWQVPLNIAVIPLFRRIGHQDIGVAAAAALFLLIATWIRRCRPDAMSTSSLALFATITCAPLAWVNYALMLAPAFVLRRWKVIDTLVALAFMVPLFVVPRITAGWNATYASVFDGTLYLVAAWIMARRAQFNCGPAE